MNDVQKAEFLKLICSMELNVFHGVALREFMERLADESYHSGIAACLEMQKIYES